MKTSPFFVLASLVIGSSAFAGSVDFACSNSSATRWKTYFCVYGTVSDDSRQLTNVTFGTCEGSRQAGEEEPVDTTDFERINHDPRRAARSAQWRNAGAFNVSTGTLGEATFYYTSRASVARLKVGREDLRLECGF